MLLPALLALVLPAPAATTCTDVAGFNAYMADHAATRTLTLRFDVTGVNPSDFAGTKGALADLTDTGCAAGGSIAMKVYGPDDPPNEAHPGGTIKEEYGYECGPRPGEETWASPNPSEVVFTDGSERCDVTVWTDPATFGYELACDHGTFTAVGDNTPAMPVNAITLFSLSDGYTWRIPNARSTWSEVCFEPGDEGGGDSGGDSGDSGGSGGGTLDVVAVEDVTVAADHVSDVFPDETDLCVEAGYCEVYLKFDLSAVPGRVVAAELLLASGLDGSANGSGAEVYPAPTAAWSEATLTWGARPGGVGAALDRIGPIVPDTEYALDVSAAVGAPGVYAFALLPAASDTDGTHFRSTEGAPSAAPTLRITWVEDAGDSGGDSGSGADSGSGGDSGAAGDSGAGDGADSGDDSGDDADSGATDLPAATLGCSCAARGGAGGSAGGVLVGLLVALRRRRARGG